MTVVQMHQTVTGHDAIGNDIEAIFKLLNAQGRRCVVFANNTLNKQVTYIEESELDSVLQEEDNIILYHHSVYWEQGFEILKRQRRKLYFDIIISLHLLFLNHIIHFIHSSVKKEESRQIH